jgi:error-prone DNA polymerase
VTLPVPHEPAAVAERYARRGATERYSLLQPDVWLTVQERQRAMLRLFARLGWRTLVDKRLLEVGCGSGGNLLEMLRLGFALVKGLREESARRLEAARRDGPFISVADVAQRTRMPRHELTRLALAGALNSLCHNRRNAMWDLHALGPFDEDDLFFGLPMVSDRADFPLMTAPERVSADFETVSLSLESHPVGLLRPQLRKLGAVTSADLLKVGSGRTAKLGGLVIVRQRPPTAKGFTFLSMEDEAGIANVIIEPQLFERFRRELTGTPLLVATGRVERSGKVVNLKVTHLEALLPELPVEPKVHHFH